MTFTLAGILFFLGASLLFYILFGGADFGAGILELFLGRQHQDQQREVISHAMAPVWEANHVWLILVVVILFMGFPEIYSIASIQLHLPIIAILMGIVARGCAFTFRHYDVLDKTYYRTYSRIFSFSSLWTAFFIGVTGGSLLAGKIDPSAPDFYSLYVASWLNPFSFTLGVFVCALFSLLASVYLVGESHEPFVRKIFLTKYRWAQAGVLISGAAVFLMAQLEHLPWIRTYMQNSLSLTCMGLATLLWVPLGISLTRGRSVFFPRLIGASIAGLVLVGWYSIQFPAALLLRDANGSLRAVSFTETAAPVSVQSALLGALTVGSLLIFPALAYLLKIFKWDDRNQKI
ncbi:MAG: cytochrome d ubiquinol oxidase subunit II [Proteobacteria bacterium]|nr:MAG: cytochrome d ubiquinol oxidase subunit II [Pseudomonadota bacterium]